MAADSIDIGSAEDFLKIGFDPDYPMNGTYNLTHDLDFGPYYGSIGAQGNPFNGTIIGNGKYVQNLTFPLFSYVDNAQISDFTIYNGSVSGPNNMGLLARFIENESIIRDLIIENSSVSGNNNIGLVAGRINESTIQNISIVADFPSLSGFLVSGDNNVGGLTGNVRDSEVLDCSVFFGSYYLTSSTNGIVGVDDVGGIIGYSENTLIQNNKVFALPDTYVSSSNMYLIYSGNRRVGGIVGFANNDSILSKNVVTGVNVNSDGPGGSGGLAGRVSNSTVTENYADANVYGAQIVGGLIGVAVDSDTSENFVRANVTSGSRAGGLIGRVDNSSIKDSFATGFVTTDISGSGNPLSQIGGLVGIMVNEAGGVPVSSSSIESSYSDCILFSSSWNQVLGDQMIGTLSANGGTVTDSYYVDASIVDIGIDYGEGIPISSESLKKISTFGTWDISSSPSKTWVIYEDLTYPRLSWNSHYIKTQADLENISNVLYGDYILSNNIAVQYSLANPVSEPIGTYNTMTDLGIPFTGTFNGNGKTISNLRYESGRNTSTGLFGFTADAVIFDLTLKNVTVNSNFQIRNGGSLIGHAKTTLVHNCSVVDILFNGTRGYSGVGGLIGAIYDSSVQYSSTDNVVTSTLSAVGSSDEHSRGSGVGGLVGYANNSVIFASSAINSNVSAASRVGGLIGILDSGSVLQSFSTGKVTALKQDNNQYNGGNAAGGLVGVMQGSEAIDVYSFATVHAAGNNAGGIVGTMNSVSPSVVQNAYYNGPSVSTEAGGNVGGISGSGLNGGYHSIVDSLYSFADNANNNNKGRYISADHMKNIDSYKASGDGNGYGYVLTSWDISSSSDNTIWYIKNGTSTPTFRFDNKVNAGDNSGSNNNGGSSGSSSKGGGFVSSGQSSPDNSEQTSDTVTPETKGPDTTISDKTPEGNISTTPEKSGIDWRLIGLLLIGVIILAGAVYFVWKKSNRN
jgi:hypothetical protein